MLAMNGRFFSAVAGAAILIAAPVFAGEWVKTDKGCAVWNSDPKAGETATWTGSCANGKVTGKGTLTWRNGNEASTYVGTYKAGKRSGTGRFDDGSGNWYSGPFVNGVPDGTGRCFAKQLGREWKCTWKAGKITMMPNGEHVTQ